MFVPMLLFFVLVVGIYVLGGRSVETMMPLGVFTLFTGLAGVVLAQLQKDESALLASLLFLLLASMCFYRCYKLWRPGRSRRTKST